MSVINAAQATQIVQSAQTGSAAGAQSTTTSATPQFVGEEFNDFLKLLTAQLRHQDPMSPLDSTQFVEQLASFSTLEQQVQSNQSLQSMASMIGDLHSMYASEWLGQTVTVESSWVPYSGNDIEYSLDVPEEATRGVLNVANSQGETVWSDEIKLSEARQSWDGRFEKGGAAASGDIFEFGIDLFAGDNFLGTVAPQVVTKVTDVGSENGAMRIGTSSRLTAELGQVRRIDE
ncbi:flagellar hook assembly protein FlgD [Henriciella marina]|uniref:flagellar hook assembly protein FlgD n=1 Tax=Henriciella marina TaxID=453851 RepID=UPI000370DBF3|nr:flagellar hook capping FlgD N-terminal domain-containing protein [Henriciella marina]